MKKLKRIWLRFLSPILIVNILSYYTLSFIVWNVHINQWGWLPRLISLIVCVLSIIYFESMEENEDVSVFGGKSLHKNLMDVGDNISKLFDEKLEKLRK